ncbi:acetylglutamate kinase [Staphylococcus capitis]|uniref:acetylglutamate kinase n=1 Tax=Staphylococcus capitis TaxID=29388 RepID=UPI001D13CB26|nr:acetylglutamate kinase [Staphylococcus capitis]MCC3754689.1 acetylglutamate kinase [Staphylococcus capitis]MDH8728707.1 acetylglutamate kinase [Staphylococcus capitis]MDH8921921.1 acetylglutamate kinase [Staphylococcus capitis]MDH8943198.1 acetylglutamate kinase [Staphylococcus capitis]MDH9591899.1 acetylglutamate kinase [Staphylococcus capitis]
MNNVIVVKIGGIATENLNSKFLNQIVKWRKSNKQIIIVHGGGLKINQTLQDHNHTTHKINGIRITNKEDLPLIYHALVNKVGKHLINQLKTTNLHIIQPTDILKDIVKTEFLNKEMYGYVGKVKEINVNLLKTVSSNNAIPVLASLGVNDNNEWLNINADYLATSLAQTLKAEQLILITDVPGVIEDKCVVQSLTIQQAEDKIRNKIITGGMIPKVKSAIITIQSGVERVMIGNNLQTGTIIRGDIK